MTAADGSLGLVAGSGEFPLLVARGAKRAGLRVVIVGLRGCYDNALKEMGDRFYETGIARLGRWIRIFRRERAFEAIMAGQVRKDRMLACPRWRQWLAYLPDYTSIRVWYYAASDRRNDTLLGAVAAEMARKGVELVDSTKYCREALAPAGLMTRCAPSAAQYIDAELGWKVAKEMGRLDIGQSVAVKDKDVIAVEAIEGTDAMISRAGYLCKAGGWTLVKVAKPNQDMRFDVPTIGPKTVEQVARSGGKVIVVEAGKTLMLAQERTIAVANNYGVAIIGRAPEKGVVLPREDPPQG